jgi:hypothetical protein
MLVSKLFIFEYLTHQKTHHLHSNQDVFGFNFLR